MTVTETKKAKAIISTFTERERSIYNTGIGYLKQDMEHIMNCDKEITVHQKNTDPQKYHDAIKATSNLSFRAKYLLQCLDIYVHDDFETMTIEVKALSDK